MKSSSICGDNDEIQEYSLLEKASLGWRTSWSERANRELRDILARESPDVAHFHNTFPLISPSAYYACERGKRPRSANAPQLPASVPQRQPLSRRPAFARNAFLILCFAPLCMVAITTRGLRASAVAGMLTVHGLLNTWAEQVDLFLVCTEFARRKFVDAGFDEEHIRVKPNFIAPDPGPSSRRGDHRALCWQAIAGERSATTSGGLVEVG